jgi:hypothetical protein
MAIATFIKSARKAGRCGRCGAEIKVGDSCFRWSFQYGGKRTNCAKHAPRGSELTQSKLSAAYAAQENFSDELDGLLKDSSVGGEDRGPVISAADALDLLKSVRQSICDAASECADEIRSVGDEYRDSAQEMPAKADEWEERADELDSAADEYEQIDNEIDEPDGDDMTLGDDQSWSEYADEKIAEMIDTAHGVADGVSMP